MMRIGLNQLLLDNSERANRFQAKIKKLRKKELECKQIEKRKDGSHSNSQSSCEFQSEKSSEECQDGDDDNIDIPFFAWECISISMKSGHDINLIIRDEENMKIFLQFLILKLKSFDGLRNTFKVIRAASKKNSTKTDKEIMQRVYNRYLLMKI